MARVLGSHFSRRIELQVFALDGTMPHWEVIGGGEVGGILVRESRGKQSKACTPRLATGAVIEELEVVGERLRYQLVSGTGPEKGWVSTKIKGKDLLIPKEPAEVAPDTGAATTEVEARVGSVCISPNVCLAYRIGKLPIRCAQCVQHTMPCETRQHKSRRFSETLCFASLPVLLRR